MDKTNDQLLDQKLCEVVCRQDADYDRVRKLLSTGEAICLMVENSEYNSFLDYCLKNGCYWKKDGKPVSCEDISRCTYYMFIEKDLSVSPVTGSVSHMKLNGIRKIKFKDIRYAGRSECLEQ